MGVGGNDVPKNAPLTLMKYKCFFAGYQKPAKLVKENVEVLMLSSYVQDRLDIKQKNQKILLYESEETKKLKVRTKNEPGQLNIKLLHDPSPPRALCVGGCGYGTKDPMVVTPSAQGCAAHLSTI